MKQILLILSVVSVVAGSLLANPDYPPTMTYFGRDSGQLGYSLAALGPNYFLAGEPSAVRLEAGVLKRGAVSVFGINRTSSLTTFYNPSSNGFFGQAIAVIDSSRFVAAAPPSPNGAITNVGRFMLCRTTFQPDASGTITAAVQVVATVLNPTNHITDGFGLSVASVGGKWLVVGAPKYDLPVTDAGRAYLYSIGSTSATLVTTITNPSPMANANFGHAISAVGADRFVVSAPNAYIGNRQNAGKLYLYHTNGTLLKTIQDPNPPLQDRNGNDQFGFALAEVGVDQFAATAIGVDQVTAMTTNIDTGALYLFHKSGQFLRTIPPPAGIPSSKFGGSVAGLGTDRLLVGAPSQNGEGHVHFYSTSGDWLTTVENPALAIDYDQFGLAVAGVGSDWFLVGAPITANQHTGDGAVHVFDARLPEYALGQEIPPPAGLALADLVDSGPEIIPEGAAFWHRPNVYDARLYATRAGRITVRWKTTSGSMITVQALNVWPAVASAYQLHVSATPPVDLKNGGAFNWAALMDSEDGTAADSALVRNRLQYSATGSGRSLLMLAANNPIQDPTVYFQLVRTVTWDDLGYLYDAEKATPGQQDAPASIGVELNSLGFHDDNCGGPWVFWPNSFYNAGPGYYDRTNRTGPIIPVNLDQPTYTDDMVVVYYQMSSTLRSAPDGTIKLNAMAWPWKAVRYRCEWPDDAEKIVIANTAERGSINATTYLMWDLYVQNDPTRPGFNPNDEHALRLPSADGEAVFPMRDDLGTPSTSQPYVLINYLDAEAGMIPKMKVFRVVAEDPPYFFDYAGNVGDRIQPPFPLQILPLCEESSAVSGPWWRDRKKEFWAKAAHVNGVDPALIVMKYFYPVQNGFYIPSNYFAQLPAGVVKTTLPPAGTHLPWLDIRWGDPGVPHDIRYTISWPTNAPALLVGETLVKPKRGLPDINSQSSVEIVYQQASAAGVGPSVALIDPTGERTTALGSLPSGIKTVTRSGKQYFTALPPHLRDRLFYDPTAPVSQRLKLRGQFVEPALGEGYLLLNLLTERDKKAARKELPLLSDAINLLPSDVIPVTGGTTNYDSLALTAGFARRGGFVTLAFGNNPVLSPKDEPVSLVVIRVDCPPFPGDVRVVDSDNPFDEKLTLRFTGDFAGRTDEYIFEWYSFPPVDGLPSTLPYTSWIKFETQVAPGHQTDRGAVDVTIEGASLLTLTDNYFVCRYRPLTQPPCSSSQNPDDWWSDWTKPMLAEGWVKRVLAGINSFDQRFKSFDEKRVNSLVSMISQAGPRYEGPVALSLEAADKFGLIEIYETVLRRAMELSIDGLPPVDYPPAQTALLLAAGRLADLYMLLGNEAYADAADPTIAFGTDDGIYGAEATSIHCFMNQTASLLEEELALLRGRDAQLQPGVTLPPIYNRLAWNFTRDINGGEVAYALNYNVRDEAGQVNGRIDEQDAKVLYPQGHGDAWGHYLTAIKYYYRLLRHPRFTWDPQAEAVLVGGIPVSVDFLDERKFARAAAAKARTGAEIVDLTYRQDYQANLHAGRTDYHDINGDRAWGVADWASRAGQGAYVDWVVANALLPDRDPTLTNPISSDDHTGIQIVDRTTVLELREILASAQDIQAKMDAADGGMNPVGLADSALSFDLNPQEVDQGRGHFDQIFDRAVRAMNNAVTVFNHANNSTQLLRRQADHQADFVTQVDEREMDFQNRLIELFGYPYEDDIGPAGTYPSGYDGPDIYHFDYNDATELASFKLPAVQVVTLPMKEIGVDDAGALTENTKVVEFRISTDGLGLIKPASWTGRRRAQGELQMARSDLIQGKARFERALVDYDNLVDQIHDLASVLKGQHNVNAEEVGVKSNAKQAIQTLNDQMRGSRERQLDLRKAMRIVNLMQDAIAEALPRAVGLANDITSVARSALRIVGVVMSEIQTEQADAEAMMEADRTAAKEVNDRLDEIKLTVLRNDQGVRSQVAQIEQLVRQEIPLRLEIYNLRETLRQSGQRYLNTLARAQRLLDERLRFRQQTAVQIQGYRYKDMAFRIFRNDALQKYRAQFDLAARYVYLAAKAFDYETCLPENHSFAASTFITDILRARSLGFLQGGVPQISNGAGEIGLADPLAWMHLYWTLIARSELGFNNPQTDTGRFSLRSELFRIQRGEAGNSAWRETLSRLVVPHFPDLPEVRRYCVLPSPLGLSEPALVIPFSTTINFGHNFFAWPLGGGDNAYDSTHNATKIRSVGVWFANYNSLVDQGLANTPHVYLIPVGVDFQRCPPDDSGYRALREWKVFEQKLPVPFQFNKTILKDNLGWIPFTDSVPPGEELAQIRKHPMFRAYHDSGAFTPGEMINSSRLIGRSVWNSRWLLIIPGGALHHDRQEGIQRLIHGSMVNGQRTGNGISDIKLFFQTYSYAGN